MLFNKKVLVALDASEAAEKAFKRGVLIADRMGCQLDLLWLFNPLPDHPLMRLVAELQVSGMAIESHYTEAGRLLNVVQKRWQEDHFSLLIKSCEDDHKGLLAPVDWQLLRQAPCPVLLVKRDSLWEGGKVMAAIDPLSQKENRLNLSRAVLMMAGFISTEAQAQLNVVVSYAPPMLAAEPENQSVSLLEARARQAAEHLLSNMKLDCKRYLIGEGPPEYWIPHVAEAEDAALVVIGTWARDGLTGMLLGNTAERILDRLTCDVLVLREGLAEDLRQLLNSHA